MNLCLPIRQRFFDSDGLPLAGGLLYSYVAGTSTPQGTYSNSTGTANTNPVVLDASGYADIWLDPTLSYKFVLKDSSGNLQWTEDFISFPNEYTLVATWATNNFGTSSDTLFTRVEAIDAAFGQTSFSFANNQGSAANVTGLVFDHTVNNSVEATVAIRLQAGSNEVYSITKLYCQYKTNAATWVCTQVDNGDLTGIIFSITSGGQVQYTSGNISGFTSGSSRFKTSPFGL